jgi:hypothetical protein
MCLILTVNKRAMKKIKFIIISILTLVIFQNCSDNDNDSSNNTCNLLYVFDAAIGLFTQANGYSLQTINNKLHQIEVKPSIGGTICGISYQNAPNYSGTYQFSIYVDNQLKYQGDLSFTQNSYEIKSIPNFQFNANQTIKVVRICNSSNPSDWIGEVFRKLDYSNINFPLTHGNIEYINGISHDNDGGPINSVVPSLLLTFKAN